MASVASAAARAVTGRGHARGRAEPGSARPRVSPVGSSRFAIGTADALRAGSPRTLRRRVRARGPVAAAQSSAATSSDGGGVAIVGLGARGCAVVDRLVSRGALRRAQFWSLSADPNALQTALAPNRWRLPPGTVDPKDSAVEENAEAVSRGILGGGVANEPPAVVVVVASASEMIGAPLKMVESLARLKDGPSQRGWFNVGGSQGITHRGPALIVAAMTPFAFEGPRKSADAVEALLAAQKRADAVTVVPQEALTGGVAANGDPLTVAEVTELADATAQWSAWTILEMFASPAWVGLDGAASESTPESKSRNCAWKYEPALSPGTFRALVAGRPKNAKLGCGACVVGYGTSTLELNFAPDQGQSAAIRVAVAAAAESSPFLRRRVFANAEFACVSVQTQATLTEAAVRAASDALAELVGVDVPQIVTAAKPDPRAPPDQVLVTLLVAAQPEDAAARDPRQRGGAAERKTPSLLGMSFPSIPGMQAKLASAVSNAQSQTPSASPSVESVGRAKRREREAREEKAREEAGAKPSETAPKVAPVDKSVVVPLPPGMDASPVAVRVLELEEDPTGGGIGYGDDPGDSDDFDDDDFGDLAEREPKARTRGLFGFAGRTASGVEDDAGSKDAVKNRLASVLDRDRGGSTRRTVRLEYAGNRVYEGEGFANTPEGVGKRVFENGDTYEGRWRDGLPDGRGVLTYARGGSFSGVFFEGKPNGPGVLDLRARGEGEVEGEWADGVLEERGGNENREE